MRVRVFRQDDGLFTVLCIPEKRTGLLPVATRGLKVEEISAVVAPIAERVDQVKQELRDVARASRGA